MQVILGRFIRTTNIVAARSVDHASFPQLVKLSAMSEIELGSTYGSKQDTSQLGQMKWTLAGCAANGCFLYLNDVQPFVTS